MKKVALVMGSKSDIEILKRAAEVLHKFGVPYEGRVLSAHRTPEEAAEFAKSAEDSFGVVIACAGKAAHLAGVIASLTPLPVIGIPAKGSFEGLDSLLSTVQMPAGIPVATVAVNGGENAALLAVRILALGEPALKEKLIAYRAEMKKKILLDDAEVSAELNSEAKKA
jgi:5-(carboxyamino)imidazole ribonucleotide mutase